MRVLVLALIYSCRAAGVLEPNSSEWTLPASTLLSCGSISTLTAGTLSGTAPAGAAATLDRANRAEAGIAIHADVLGDSQ